RARVHRAALGGGRLGGRAFELRRRREGRPAAARRFAFAVPAAREGAGAGAAAGRGGVRGAEDQRVSPIDAPKAQPQPPLGSRGVNRTLSQLSDALAAGEIGAEALLEQSLARIRALDGK